MQLFLSILSFLKHFRGKYICLKTKRLVLVIGFISSLKTKSVPNKQARMLSSKSLPECTETFINYLSCKNNHLCNNTFTRKISIECTLYICKLIQFFFTFKGVSYFLLKLSFFIQNKIQVIKPIHTPHPPHPPPPSLPTKSISYVYI